MTRRPLTIGLLWHSADSANLGVGALTASQIAILSELPELAGRELRFVVMGPDAPAAFGGGDPRIEAVGVRDRDMPKPWGTLWRAVRRCDVVLDIGAGDSFTDLYGARRFARILAAKFVVIGLGRPLVLSPQTVGPFSAGWARRLARLALRGTRQVWTRDAASTAFLREMGHRGEVHEATDVALRLPADPPAPAPRAGGAPRAGLNVSGLLFNGGYSSADMFRLACDYPDLVRRAIARLQALGAQVHLLAHVNSGRIQVEDDHRVCAALAEEFPGAVLAPRFSTPSQAKGYIAGLDFFAGARMHACIAAFSSGVPVVPMAYSRKFAGLFGTLGYDRTADCRSEGAEEVLAKLEAGFRDRARLAGEVAAAGAEGEARLSAYAAGLGALLASLPVRQAPA